MTDFANLVEREHAGLQAAVVVIVGDRGRAEEIVQDAFERCFRRWRTVSKLDRPGAWVRRVAINEAISHTRRRGSERRALALVAAQASAIDASSESVSTLDDVELWAAVRDLSTEQMTAIALHYGADLSIEHIAETMKLSPTAVKSLLHRGRTALRGSDAFKERAQ